MFSAQQIWLNNLFTCTIHPDWWPPYSLDSSWLVLAREVKVLVLELDGWDPCGSVDSTVPVTGALQRSSDGRPPWHPMTCCLRPLGLHGSTMCHTGTVRPLLSRLHSTMVAISYGSTPCLTPPPLFTTVAHDSHQPSFPGSITGGRCSLPQV